MATRPPASNGPDDKRVVLDCAAFLDSPQALAVSSARTADIRTIVGRYLAACYTDLGKAPRLLQGDEMETVLVEILPRRFGVKDPLAEPTEDVLLAFLGFLEESEVVPAIYEQRRALDACAGSFRAAVASGAAHREGLAVTSRPKPVVHRADKTGRNDPCPCGSGKKFKKCCMHLQDG